MAFNVNRVTIVGRLGQDAEHKSFQNGGGVVNLRVATSEQWKDRDGAKQERTEWHTVAVFAKWLIDDARKLRKGDTVMIEGKLQTRKWQDQSGNDRYSTEIVLQGMESSLFKMAPRAPAGGGQQQQGGGAPNYAGASQSEWDSAAKAAKAAPADDLDDDIPF